MKQDGTASKTCEKHGNSTVPFIVEFSFFGNISSGSRDTGQLSPHSNLEVGSCRELRSLF